MLVPTLAERLQARGLRLAGVGSGSTGSTFLLDPRAPDGVGVLVNGYFEPGKVVAYPADVSAAILARFGPAPPKGGLADRYDAVVTWTQRVLREYVLPELRPAVVINWLTEPDHSQHGVGVGSPSARAALRHDDREIALVLKHARDARPGRVDRRLRRLRSRLHHERGQRGRRGRADRRRAEGRSGFDRRGAGQQRTGGGAARARP